MKKLKWYFNQGKIFELFSVLYEKDGWMVVKNDNTEKYSFGLSGDFGTFSGFPADQSCLSSGEIKNVLEDFINIDRNYIEIIPEIATENIKRWQNMMESILI